MKRRFIQIARRRFCDQLSTNDIIRIQQCFQKELHEGVVSAYERLFQSNGHIDRESLLMVLHGYARSACRLNPQALMAHAQASGIELDQQLFADFFTVCVLKDDHRGVHHVLDVWCQSFPASEFPWDNVLNLLIQTYGMQHHVVQNSIMRLSANIISPAKLFSSFHNYSSQQSIKNISRELEKSIQLGYTSVAFKKFNQLEAAHKKCPTNVFSSETKPDWVTLLVSCDLQSPKSLPDLPARLQKLGFEFTSPELNQSLGKLYLKPQKNIDTLRRALEYYTTFECQPDAKVWNILLNEFLRSPESEVKKDPSLPLTFIRNHGTDAVMRMYYTRLVDELLKLNPTDVKLDIYKRCLIQLNALKTSEFKDLVYNDHRNVTLESIDDLKFAKHAHQGFLLVKQIRSKRTQECPLKIGDRIVSIISGKANQKIDPEHRHFYYLDYIKKSYAKHKKVTFTIESNDFQRIFDYAPVHSPALFTFSQKYNIHITTNDFRRFVTAAIDENDTQSLVKILETGARWHYGGSLDDVTYSKILDVLLMAPVEDTRLTFDFKKEYSDGSKGKYFVKREHKEGMRRQVSALEARRGTIEEDHERIDERVLNFLTLLSSYYKSKRTGKPWNPAVLFDVCSTEKAAAPVYVSQARGRRQVDFVPTLESMVTFLCVSKEPKCLAQLLTWMSEVSITPTHRMRQTIDAHVDGVHKEALLDTYFNLVSMSEGGAIFHRWLKRGNLQEALYWVKKKNEHVHEEDRLLCLISLGRHLNKVEPNQYRHHIHSGESRNESQCEVVVPTNVWKDKNDFFMAPLAVIDLECDVRVKETGHGWRIRGTKSEQQRAVGFLREHFQQNNFITSLPNAYGLAQKLSNDELRSTHFGGIEGQDEVHLWGNPFVRRQKARMLGNAFGDEAEMCVLRASQTFVERLQKPKFKFPIEAVETATNTQIVFPASTVGNQVYILGKPADRKRAVQTILSLNPPVNNERVTSTNKATGTLFKTVQPEDVSVLDIQWLTNRMTTEEGQYIGQVILQITNASPESVKRIPSRVFAGLTPERTQDLVSCFLEMLLAKGNLDQFIDLALEHVDHLSANEWHRVFEKFFIAFGNADHSRLDCVGVMDKVELLLEMLGERYESERLLSSTGVMEFIYNAHMNKSPRLCHIGLQIAHNYCGSQEFSSDIYKWIATSQKQCALEFSYFLNTDLKQGASGSFGRNFLKLCRKIDAVSLGHFLQDFVTQIPLDRLGIALAQVGNVACIELLLLKLEWIYRTDIPLDTDQMAIELIALAERGEGNIQAINQCLSTIVQFQLTHLHESNLNQDTFTEIIKHYANFQDTDRLTNICQEVLERKHVFQELYDVIQGFPNLKAAY